MKNVRLFETESELNLVYGNADNGYVTPWLSVIQGGGVKGNSVTVSETHTLPPTQAPTEGPTQGPTEAPTDCSTEGPTEEPTEGETLAPISEILENFNVIVGFTDNGVCYVEIDVTNINETYTYTGYSEGLCYVLNNDYYLNITFIAYGNVITYYNNVKMVNNEVALVIEDNKSFTMTKIDNETIQLNVEVN